MNAVKQDVEKLVQKELEAANQKFPMFRSDHEGAAVIVEKIEETKTEMDETEKNFKVLWTHVKLNNGMICSSHANDLYKRACKLAIEAIQVAAMAQKFIDSKKERDNQK